MRKLKGSDIFKLSKILKKMDLKLETKKNTTEAMLDIFKKAFENIHLAEKEVNIYLADLHEMEVEVLEELSLKKYVNLLKEIKDNEDIKGLFTSVEQTQSN